MPPFGTPRPDFLAQRPAGPGIYPSTRALGQLFRAIPEQQTDTPFGAQPSWNGGDRQSALSNILKQPGKSDDLLAILSALAQKYPQIMPQGLRLVQMQEPFRPLMLSFVYHLSRLAAWIPESRTETEWLSEEEILIGTQVMATKAKQLKRRQERLTASTAELFPILKAQMQLIASDESVITSTIRPSTTEERDADVRAVPGSAPSAKKKAKGKSKAQDEPEGIKHFVGYTQLAEPPQRSTIIVVNGERVVLREKPSASGTPRSPWSDDRDDFNQRSHYRETKDALNKHINKSASKFILWTEETQLSTVEWQERYSHLKRQGKRQEPRNGMCRARALQDAR